MDATNVVTRDLEPGRSVPGAEPPETGPADSLSQPSPPASGGEGWLREVAALKEEMAAAWQRGERPLAEEFLVRLPSLRNHSDGALQLIYQEICLRSEHDEPQASVAVVRRFPQWEPELRALLDQRQPQLLAGAPIFPEVGEGLGDFQLLAELGRGALGRVFLAHQSSLADRPVVLKLTPCRGQEHLSLARLQHTHIVPLYWVQDYQGRNLRVLCMPYLGGAAMSILLDRLHTRSHAERTGSQLVQELDALQAESPAACPSAGPARHFLMRTSFVQTICWIGACLAEALQYAHERGLVHLDLKPSNVLLAADGQPMLLDFHLARGPIEAGVEAPDRLGGTPLYMSPEQKAAVAVVRQRGVIGCAVDGRSDIYSLGLLLYEALADPLTQPSPPAPAGEGWGLPAGQPPPLHKVNRQVSVGLSDIIHKCLAPIPADRYPNAAALALDLRLHLTDQPLRGVRNRSWGERWTKWRRRRPYAVALWGLVLAVSATLVAVGVLVRRQEDQAHRQVETVVSEGEQLMVEGKYSEAVRVFGRGLTLAGGLSRGREELKSGLDGRLYLAQRALAAQDLHAVADQVRFTLDPSSMSSREARDLEERCRGVWQRRDRIHDPEGTRLPAELEKRIQTDLLDLALLWSDLNVRLTPASNAAAAHREALEVINEVERLFGASPALHRERQLHAEALGRHDLAAESARAANRTTPHTSWDHYALGRFLFQQGDRDRAAVEFDRAVALQPQGFWPNFYQGVCAYRRGDPEKAVRAFSVCIALAPDQAVCHFNRGLAWAGRPGHTKQSLQDYDRALELQPTLHAASLNRGILHYREGRYESALLDLEAARRTGAHAATVYYNEALVHVAQQNRTAALNCLKQALRLQPDYEPACKLREQLQGPGS